jgi:hypothetical protein
MAKPKMKVAKYDAQKDGEDGLKAFPTELLEQKDAEDLNLYGVFDYRKTIAIPDAIAKMTGLRKIQIGMAKFTLPEGMCRLPNLEELDLAYAEELRSLPKSLGSLKSLKTLTLNYSNRLKELPESIGKLPKLESLTTDPGGLKSVPASLFNVKTLKTLTLPEGVKKLPPGISKLVNLETLALGPEALWSIAKELPKMTSLKSLNVWGKAKKVPEEIGALTNLTELSLLYMENVAELPRSLTNLRSLRKLDVSGNALTELQWLVRALPKLKELDYDQNKLPLKERRAIEALMRLPPQKRGAATTPTKAVPIEKPKPLGSVLSVNSYLAMLLVDGSHAPAWRGVGDDDDNEDDSDWARFAKEVGNKVGGPVKVGEGKGIGVAMVVGQGVGRVFRTTHGLALIEGFVDDEKDPIFLEYVSAPPEKAKSIGKLDVKSGALAITPSTDGCEDVAKKLAKLKADKALSCGSEDSSLLVPVPKGAYEVLVEKEVERSWGSARRAIVRPLA